MLKYVGVGADVGRRVALVAGFMCLSLGALTFGHTGTAHAATACPLPFNGVASVTSLPSGDKLTGGTATVTLTGNPGVSVAFKPQPTGVVDVSQTGSLACGTVPIVGIGPTAGSVSGSLTLNTGAVCTWDGSTLTYIVSDSKGHDSLSFDVTCTGGIPAVVSLDIGIGATGSTATPEAGSGELLGTGLVVLGGSMLLARRRRARRRA